MTCGILEGFNQSCSRVSCKTDKPLEKHWSMERTFFRVTTSDDPVIKKFAQSNTGTVFATDAIITHLMSIPKSVFPWDLVVRKKGNQLFFDKPKFDYLSVDENSNEPPRADTEPPNNAAALSQEATFINQNFSQQILLKEAKSFRMNKPNPFVTNKNEKVASVAYRYRKWKIGDHELVCRCEMDGVMPDKNGAPVFMVIKALNEYDPKLTGDWRQKLDSHRGGVLASEIKNNACKFTKWVAQAVLADADSFTLGYVARQKPKDNMNHVILGVQTYNSKALASTTLQMNMNDLWGSIKFFIDTFMKLEEGKYILMKDPEKPLMKLYKTNEKP